MLQKNKNHRNQGSIDINIDFFPVSKSQTQMGSLSVKKASEKFHDWEPLEHCFKILKHVAGHALKKIVNRSVAFINIRRKINVDAG
jgi:hypothetical protein